MVSNLSYAPSDEDYVEPEPYTGPIEPNPNHVPADMVVVR